MKQFSKQTRIELIKEIITKDTPRYGITAVTDYLNEYYSDLEIYTAFIELAGDEEEENAIRTIWNETI